MSAIIITNNTELMQRVIDEIKTCYDPEIPVDVWELGLIYELDLNDEHELKITMTLTSPNCPVAESLPAEVENKLKSYDYFTRKEILAIHGYFDKNNDEVIDFKEFNS